MSRGGKRQGAGRPPAKHALRESQLQVGLTPELEACVDREVAKTGDSRAEVARRLMLAGAGKLRVGKRSD